jgi:branched-chain amino acid transport system permease protein
VDAFLTSRAFSDLLSGLVTGVVIGLIALSLVLIWRSTHILNFAQGAMATFGAYIGLTQLSHLGYWYCLAIAIVAGMVIGGATERLLVRRLHGKPELNPIVVMVGLLFTLEAVCATIWGTTPRSDPMPFSFIDWHLGGNTFALSPNNAFQIVAALVVAIAVALLFRFTNLGLQLRAAAVAPEVSRLLGVNVGALLTLGWVLSSGVGVVAAVIYGSGFGVNLSPGMMEAPFAVAFIAAAIGGLESPSGALVVGIIFGMIQQYSTDYLNNSNDYLMIALGVLVVVLVIRPSGLFSRRVVRRV